MPYKRPNSKYYRLKLELPGYGSTGQLSCRTTKKVVAQQMEGLLRTIAERGLVEPQWHVLLDAVTNGSISLPELLKSDKEGSLMVYLRKAKDPTLDEAIEQYVATDPDYITRKGLDLLRRMARLEFGDAPSFGVLRSGKNISLLCARAKREGSERGDGSLKQNSVRRLLYDSCSKLVAFHLGPAERDNIFASVDFRRVDDRRDVWLNAEEVAALLEACEDWFRPFVLTAISTGADRSPLMRMLVRDVEIIRDEEMGRLTGTVYLRDTKTDSRSRSVPIVDPVSRAMQPLLEGKGPDDRVFEGPSDPARSRSEPITASQVRYWFEKARSRAGLGHVRFKDLRHTWAVNADRAGLSLGKMQANMGHTLDETTVRYTKRQVRLEQADAERVAKQMGLLGDTDG